MSYGSGIGNEGHCYVAISCGGVDFEEDVGRGGGGEVGLELLEVFFKVGGFEWNGRYGYELFVGDACEEGPLVRGGDEGVEGMLELL